MKLFWKLFCSMVLMTVCFCSFGGYYLIYRQFETSLNKEIDGIFEENDFLCHMIMQKRKLQPMDSIEEITKELELSVGQRKLYFRISDTEGNRIGGNGILPVKALPLVGSLFEGQQGWELTPLENGSIYLHGAAAMVLNGQQVFLENYKNVTGLYEERQEQIHAFYSMMAVFVCMIGIVSFAVVKLLFKPVTLLSDTTRRIAGGELHKRVPIKSDDELGQLSEDFNSMADSLEQKIEELEDGAKRQEEFMGSFAHEMKTPLTSIIGYADMLRSMNLSPEKVHENADYIFKEGRRLENLSMKMMDLIVLGNEELSLKRFPVRRLFERLDQEMRPVLEKNQIEFETAWEEQGICMDEDLMITVCLNLLDNGRKAILQKRTGREDDRMSNTDAQGHIKSSGFLKGCLRLNGFYDSDGYHICVTDNGIGIPKEDLIRVKDAFYMVDKSRARAMGGAGLGLSICERIIRLHGGELLIESNVGEGTQITIILKGGETVELHEKV
ncbi:MAG: HAMP domain-containing histidine kinase [Lachnospiraceae bacterium]|nr:HAMP domain-containing histidine kinase [Lachnospiraceae bacterium]